MAHSQTAATPPRSRRNGRAKPLKPVTTEAAPPTDNAPDSTFITSDGEILTFPEMGMPLGKAAAIAGEEALSKIWNQPVEDAAWRDICGASTARFAPSTPRN